MSTNWIRSDNVSWEELGDKAVVVDLAANSASVLNATATHIWKNCDWLCMEQITADLARASNRCLHDVEADVRNFLEVLRARGLFSRTEVFSTQNCMTCNAEFRGMYEIPAMKHRSLGPGMHRRPSPRGNSGPG